MGLSDCSKCWETPCQCGWDYRNWTMKSLVRFRNMIEAIIQYKSNNPDACFSIFGLRNQEQTQDDKALMEYVNNKIGERDA